jgi:hypothetical protein
LDAFIAEYACIPTPRTCDPVNKPLPTLLIAAISAAVTAAVPAATPPAVTKAAELAAAAAVEDAVAIAAIAEIGSKHISNLHLKRVKHQTILANRNRRQDVETNSLQPSDVLFIPRINQVRQPRKYIEHLPNIASAVPHQGTPIPINCIRPEHPRIPGSTCQPTEHTKDRHRLTFDLGNPRIQRIRNGSHGSILETPGTEQGFAFITVSRSNVGQNMVEITLLWPAVQNISHRPLPQGTGLRQ